MESGQEQKVSSELKNQNKDALKAVTVPQNGSNQLENAVHNQQRLPALSPSLLNTFKQCPLKFRFTYIDKIPKKRAFHLELGKLVHLVLENLFDLPPLQRTQDAIPDLLNTAWNKTLNNDPDMPAEVFDENNTEADLLSTAKQLSQQYFKLEMPSNLQPAHREKYVRTKTKSGLTVHGFIDRVDIAPNGAVRIIDYKTGKAPKPQYIGSNLFQLKVYALMWKNAFGSLPARTQLLFVKEALNYTYDPNPIDIDKTEAEITMCWNDISESLRSGDFQMKQSKLCDWCDYQKICPLFNGTGELAPMNEDNAKHMLLIES